MPDTIDHESDAIVRDEVLRKRIRELLPEKAHRSRIVALLSHPLTALVVGFLLTAGLGTMITAHFQGAAEVRKREAEVRESRRALALTAVDSVGLSLNRTYFAYGIYYDALRQRGEGRVIPLDTIVSRRASFARAKQDFESREFVDQARVCVAFGPVLQAQYRFIADSLHWFDVKVRELQEGTRDARDVGESITTIRNAVSALALRMVEIANQGTVDVPSGSCNARSENRDITS